MPKATKKKKTEKSTNREVVYSEPSVVLFAGDEALTMEKVKEYLGWIEEEEEDKFGSDFDLKDNYGKKIRCVNNVNDQYRNRPFNQGNCASIQQEILRKKWKLNLQDNIVLGMTALILNGQHRLIGFILAVQEWEQKQDKWDNWKDAPVLETTVAFGADEANDVVNTMDTGRGRSLTDVIYRSDYFGDMTKKDCITCSRITEYAIRTLWHRTGASLDAFAPRRTHSESLDFLARHPRILEAVKHIYEENSDDNQIGRYVGLGYAAGFLYLMGCCDSELTAYNEYDSPREDLLNWNKWETACDFWILLAGNAKELKAVENTLKHIVDDDGDSLPVRCALLVKAWNYYGIGESVTPKRIELEYQTDEDGFRKLAECPTVGGIDLGNPSDASVPDPTPEEIENGKKVERENRENGNKKKVSKKATKKKTTTKKAKATKKKKEDGFKEGEVVWILDADGDACDGVIEEIYTDDNLEIVKIKVAGGTVLEALIDQLTYDEPE